ncbi:MAG TPA: hypothetical protein PLY01_07950 [Caldisericia bacterium]|nr:hypothetical protein [Caldisericia bacterium]
MPIFREGNLFKENGFKLVTTNSCLTKDCRLVMGRGAAKELKVISPGIDRIFGKMIRKACGHLGLYGLLISPPYGIFQVKNNFADKAKLEIISYSLRLLDFKARDTDQIIHLNYPGIGNGRLTKEEVRPLLEILPDNVHIWERKEKTPWLTHQN